MVTGKGKVMPYDEVKQHLGKEVDIYYDAPDAENPGKTVEGMVGGVLEAITNSEVILDWGLSIEISSIKMVKRA